VVGVRPSSVQALAALHIGWQALAASSTAIFCVLFAIRHLRSIATLRPPDPGRLLSDLLAELGVEDARSEKRAAVADLNQRLFDVSFELGLLPARFTALTRICLSSCTAWGLFGYIGATERTVAERGLGFIVCAFGGLFGAGAVLFIGRTAKQRTGLIRASWDRTSREVGKALGTTLDNPSARFEL
jgi:hypothetical protein